MRVVFGSCVCDESEAVGVGIFTGLSAVGLRGWRVVLGSSGFGVAVAVGVRFW